MLRILELSLLVLGLIILLRKQVPYFLKITEDFFIAPADARLLGLILMIPLPLALALVLAAYALVEDSLTAASTLFEPLAMLICVAAFFLLQLVFSYRYEEAAEGQPRVVLKPHDDELRIAGIARQAVYFTAVAGFGITAPVYGVLALRRANSALALIAATGQGTRFRRALRILRPLAIGLTLVYGAVILFALGRLLGLLHPLAF